MSLEALRQVEFDGKLRALGFTKPQLSAAIGNVEARMVAPGSERFTHAWLQQHSALGELIDYDFETMSPMQLYRAIRLERGRTLVRQTSLSLTEVALACGFASNSHFSREYRKRFATTPAADWAKP